MSSTEDIWCSKRNREVKYSYRLREIKRRYNKWQISHSKHRRDPKPIRTFEILYNFGFSIFGFHQPLSQGRLWQLWKQDSQLLLCITNKCSSHFPTINEYCIIWFTGIIQCFVYFDDIFISASSIKKHKIKKCIFFRII